MYRGLKKAHRLTMLETFSENDLYDMNDEDLLFKSEVSFAAPSPDVWRDLRHFSQTYFDGNGKADVERSRTAHDHTVSTADSQRAIREAVELVQRAPATSSVKSSTNPERKVTASLLFNSENRGKGQMHSRHVSKHRNPLLTSTSRPLLSKNRNVSSVTYSMSKIPSPRSETRSKLCQAESSLTNSSPHSLSLQKSAPLAQKRREPAETPQTHDGNLSRSRSTPLRHTSKIPRPPAPPHESARSRNSPAPVHSSSTTSSTLETYGRTQNRSTFDSCTRLSAGLSSGQRVRGKPTWKESTKRPDALIKEIDIVYRCPYSGEVVARRKTSCMTGAKVLNNDAATFSFTSVPHRTKHRLVLSRTQAVEPRSNASDTLRGQRSRDMEHKSLHQRAPKVVRQTSPCTEKRRDVGQVQRSPKPLCKGLNCSRLSDGQRLFKGVGEIKRAVTVPKPFALSGDKQQVRTEDMIKQSRKRAAAVDSRRVPFHARPMPDFSKL